MEQQTFDLLLLTMSALAVVVFAALYYVRAGYGMFQTSKWGISLNNKLGWILMEAPVFFVMLYLWWNSSVRCSAVPLVFFLLFELHYFQRDERKEPDAYCHYVDGSGIQCVEWFYAGRVAFLSCSRRTLFGCMA